MPLLRTVPEVVSCKRHCRGPASRTPGLETAPKPLVCGDITPLVLVAPTEVVEAGRVEVAVWAGGLEEWVVDVVVVWDEDKEEEEVLVSVVETSTLKFEMTRSALPVNGSVPVWIAWRYCVFATPWFPMRYSMLQFFHD